MTDAVVFGLELKRARERRGLSLDQVADITKISASLFAGLERGDLSRWPSGIFRRAFIRNYAATVGLDADEVAARFARVYPDGEGAAGVAHAPGGAEPAAPTAAPQLVLGEGAAVPRASGSRRAARRAFAAAIDVAMAAVPAAVVGALVGWHWFWVTACVVGLAGHLLALSLLGTTPGVRLLQPRSSARMGADPLEPPARRRAEPEATPAPRRHQSRHTAAPRGGPGSGRGRRVEH
jgi:transcriptional regulator with XRE-family HTH domain